MCALVTGVQTCALPIFNPAFLGRTTVIPFYPLRDDNMRKIVRLKLGKIARRIRANHGASFDYDDALVDAVAARCTEVDSGARNIDHILTGTLLPEIAPSVRSEEHTSELQSLMRISYADFCLQKKTTECKTSKHHYCSLENH